MKKSKALLLAIATILWPTLPALASIPDETAVTIPDLTASPWGIGALIIFVIAYLLVISEEKLHLRKSKPVLLAAGLLWVLVALAYRQAGLPAAEYHNAVKAAILEYSELLLFLLSAMTYINVMEERNVFQALRSWLVSRGFSLRTIFWLSGILAFFISAVADNLTTALVMGAVVMAVGQGHKKFVALSCISIVVAANAGGAFSPFGDITTLMVWQKGRLEFFEFFSLFLPALINWLLPAALMSLAVAKAHPRKISEPLAMKFGARRIMGLFLLTIITAVTLHSRLELPPAVGMMLGLSFLGIFSYYIKIKEKERDWNEPILGQSASEEGAPTGDSYFDVMRQVARVEWDTLLFFYGVMLCVGGLAQFGYLAKLSHQLYTGLGATSANIMVGLISSVLDNIPVMYAVLTMNPEMSHGQWLLVTLTAGVGGSLLSIGSAAGVALMGAARESYTFSTHLKWAPAVALGYAASIYAHLLINRSLF